MKNKERKYSAIKLSTETEENFDNLFGRSLEDHVEQFYFHSDHLGSSNYITNYDGNITQHSEYLPFGELLVDEHRNSHNTRYKFNGKEFDQETGNYYYEARYYDPKTSLWLSVDPLAEKYNEWSPYNYTLNNPVRYVDPDGRSVDEAGKNCCPWPVSEEIGNFFGQIRDKVDTMLDFEINISLPTLDDGGGTEGYGDGPKNNGRNGKANMAPTDFSELPSPFVRAKIGSGKMGPFIAGFKNGVTLSGNSKKAVDKTKDYLKNKSKTFEAKVPTGELDYIPCPGCGNGGGAVDIINKDSIFIYSSTKDSIIKRKSLKRRKDSIFNQARKLLDESK